MVDNENNEYPIGNICASLFQKTHSFISKQKCLKYITMRMTFPCFVQINKLLKMSRDSVIADTVPEF